MLSPFPYDKLPDITQFFGREKELEKLSSIVKYGNNLLIYSKRRMGKSSLIKNFLEQKKDEYLTIYVDIFDITSKEDFITTLLKALANTKKFDLKSAIKTLTSLFKRVRIEPTIDTNSLEYSLKPIVATLSFEEMVDDFFHSLNELSKTHKIILAIDEFQQIDTISDLKIDAMMRKYIQERENISYIFLGSKRHLLTSLFEYKAPLYEMATHFALEPLQKDALFEYAKQHLPITSEQIDYIYQISDGETKIIQQILHHLFVQYKETITNENIDNVIDEIIRSKDSSYKLLFDTLANNQKLALKIVGKYKSGFFNNALLTEYNVKKQTLQSSIDALFKKEIIDKENDKYFIPDRTFELWVERSFK